MINQAARAEARRVASGKQVGPGFHSKVELYGLFGRAIAKHELFQDTGHANSFEELETMLHGLVRARTLRGFYALESGVKLRIEQLFTARDRPERAAIDRAHPIAERTIERIDDGAKTAANREVTTLRTIARSISEGGSIAAKGLAASQRVPFQLSLLHLYGLPRESVTHETWTREVGGDDGEVLAKDLVTMDPVRGLSIVGLPDFEHVEDHADMEAHGPRIGCPASLVSDYIEGVHRQTARFAVASGLLAID